MNLNPSTKADTTNGERRVSMRLGGTMKAWIGVAMVGTLTLCGTIASSAQEPTPAVDNMSSYRMLATDTLTAFRAHDMPAAKKKARELEVAWDTREKALQNKSPDLWGQIDKAMDAFIKPLQDKAPDAAKVQMAYSTFIAKLQLAVKSDAAPQR